MRTLYDTEALNALKGRTIIAIEGLEPGSGRVVFDLDDGRWLVMRHAADCCETVEIVQVDGDPSDLTDSPIVMAEIVSNASPRLEYADSYTWTFVKFATASGYVTVRWLGQSNGYYGEIPEITLS